MLYRHSSSIVIGLSLGNINVAQVRADGTTERDCATTRIDTEMNPPPGFNATTNGIREPCFYWVGFRPETLPFTKHQKGRAAAGFFRYAAITAPSNLARLDARLAFKWHTSTEPELPFELP
jgi:hypothetical protein